MSATTSSDRDTESSRGTAGEGQDAPAEEAGAPSAAEVRLGRREVVGIIGGLALAMFLSALNQTIVATALPTIGRAFDDFDNLSWVVIAYLLTSTVVAPLYGKLSDIYGRRGMMLVALGVFIAGSAASAAGKRVGDNIARSGRRSVAALNDAGGGCRRRAERPSPLRRA